MHNYLWAQNHVITRGIQSALGPFCNQAPSGSLGRFFRESLKSGVADSKGAENEHALSKYNDALGLKNWGI